LVSKAYGVYGASLQASWIGHKNKLISAFVVLLWCTAIGLCKARPIGQAKPGRVAGFMVALARLAFLKSQSQAVRRVRPRLFSASNCKTWRYIVGHVSRLSSLIRPKGSPLAAEDPGALQYPHHVPSVAQMGQVLIW
jgi:hypothetical protein